MSGLCNRICSLIHEQTNYLYLVSEKVDRRKREIKGLEVAVNSKEEDDDDDDDDDDDEEKDDDDENGAPLGDTIGESAGGGGGGGAAVVCWEAGKAAKVEEIQVDTPKAGEVRVKMLKGLKPTNKASTITKGGLDTQFDRGEPIFAS
ncbi:hypothetical protein LguiA_036237 [Lonicera macranthoides]